jgi:hypothetical protein
MIEAYILTFIVGQLFGHLYFYPRTERREPRVWFACVLPNWEGGRNG